MNFYDELKSRNVFKIGVAYLVIGWVLIQVGGSLFPTFDAPTWVLKVYSAIILMGFPIALVIAWAFEVTPDGIKATKSDKSPLGLMVGAIVLVSIGGFYFLGEKNEAAPVKPPVEEISAPALQKAEDKSIAVLPFVDMSSSGDQEYLGDGISEEILNVLVRGHELRVAGRTSSFQFKGQNKDLRSIGEALGVAYILEGSIRKAGERVRVTAQLIKASDGFHVWSNTYDRTLDDIFALQDDIAASISNALETSLDFGGDDIKAARTTNSKANEFYLLGIKALNARGDDVAYSVVLFKAATDLDPNFAAAWSALGFAYNQLFGRDYILQEPFGPYRIEQVVFAMNKALDLNPNDPKAHHLKANLHRRNEEWFQAEAEYELALNLSPQSAAIYEDYSEFLMEVGRSKQAVIAAKKAYELEPLVPLFIENYGEALEEVGKFDEAKTYYHLAFKSNSESRAAIYIRLFIAFSNGHFDEFLNMVDGLSYFETDQKEDMKKMVSFAKGESDVAPLIVTSGEEVLKVMSMINRGEVEEAFELYIINNDDRYFNILSIYHQKLRILPKFKAQLIKVGLVDYWRTTGKWADFCKPLGEDGFECGLSAVAIE